MSPFTPNSKKRALPPKGSVKAGCLVVFRSEVEQRQRHNKSLAMDEINSISSQSSKFFVLHTNFYVQFVVVDSSPLFFAVDCFASSSLFI